MSVALPRLGACPAPAKPIAVRPVVRVTVDYDRKTVRVQYTGTKGSDWTYQIPLDKLEGAISNYEAMGYTVVHVV